MFHSFMLQESNLVVHQTLLSPKPFRKLCRSYYLLECIITNIRTERDRILPSRQWNTSKSPNDYDGSFKCSKYYLPSRVIYSSLQIGERCSFLEISTFQFWPDLLHTKQAWLSTPSKGESEMKKNKFEIVISASWTSFSDDYQRWTF